MDKKWLIIIEEQKYEMDNRELAKQKVKDLIDVGLWYIKLENINTNESRTKQSKSMKGDK